MEHLTWTGALSPLNLFLALAFGVLVLAILVQMVLSLIPSGSSRAVYADGTMSSDQGLSGFVGMILQYALLTTLGIIALYVVAGVLMGPNAGIIGGMSQQLLPVWIALIVTYAVSITFKRKLGLYGKMFDSTVGMIGFGLVMFWVFAGFFGGVMDWVTTHDTLSQVSGMKNKGPGTPLNGAEAGDYQWFLLGGDNLARDVFSRLFDGAWIVVLIAPMATLFAFMVGITLGLPAGYYGGKLDTFLSFLAN
ncbi:MAG: ABC transporter permease, partial [Sulfitobacter sp.]|nr:ABC transporter permease [Sulfitobacter sp.]